MPLVIKRCLEEESLKTGVYCISNLLNGKVYVGSAAKGFSSRWVGHKQALSRGDHHSDHLLAAWRKYGESNFEFSILIRCPPEQCLRYEQYFINKLKAADPRYGYNMSPTAGNTFGFRYNHTRKTKTKMKLSHSGKQVPWHHKIAAACRGRKNSEAAKAKMRAGWIKRKMKYGPSGKKT